MRSLNIKKLPLYPKQRPCAASTTEGLFEPFVDLQCHRLVDTDGALRRALLRRARLAATSPVAFARLLRQEIPVRRRGYRSRRLTFSEIGRRKLPRNHVRNALKVRSGDSSEADLQTSSNDVDYCIRALKAGYRNIWTP